MKWLNILFNRLTFSRSGGTVNDGRGGTRSMRSTAQPEPGDAKMPSPSTESLSHLLPDEPSRLMVEAQSDADEFMGIGAYTTPPCQLCAMEDKMQKNTLKKSRNIRVSERDIVPIRRLVSSALSAHGGITLEYIRCLSDELQRAEIVPVSCLPENVVALNSYIWVTDLDSDYKITGTIVAPEHVGRNNDYISVISPLGMAVFGYAGGDRLEWGPRQRPMRLQIDRVRQG